MGGYLLSCDNFQKSYATLLQLCFILSTCDADTEDSPLESLLLDSHFILCIWCGKLGVEYVGLGIQSILQYASSHNQKPNTMLVGCEGESKDLIVGEGEEEWGFERKGEGEGWNPEEDAMQLEGVKLGWTLLGNIGLDSALKQGEEAGSIDDFQLLSMQPFSNSGLELNESEGEGEGINPNDFDNLELLPLPLAFREGHVSPDKN